MPLTGRAIAIQSRYEMFVEMRPFGRFGRVAIDQGRKGRACQEIHPFKLKRAQDYRSSWMQRETIPFLSDRIKRVMLIQHPFSQIKTPLDLMDMVEDIRVTVNERKASGWSFQGNQDGKTVTVITAPLNPAPTGPIKAGLLPHREIYLEIKERLLAYCPIHGLCEPTLI